MLHEDLKHWRMTRDLTLSQAEKVIGVCRQTLARIEKEHPKVSDKAKRKVLMAMGQFTDTNILDLPRGLNNG